MQRGKGKGLLEHGYSCEEVDKLIDLLGDRIRHCTKEVRNIELVINNDVLLRQQKGETEHARVWLEKQKQENRNERTFLKLLVNKITGEEHYKHDDLD